jgi:Na+/H+-dicarboxylate symporter
LRLLRVSWWAFFSKSTQIVNGVEQHIPGLGEKLKPLGDAFIRLIKMIIAPVIFCTVVSGIAGMESMKSVGKLAALRCYTLKSFQQLHF